MSAEDLACLAQMDKEELLSRVELCKLIIQIVESLDDPRRDEALAIYRGQLAEISQVLAERLAGKPPDIIIGLKPVTLTGKPS